MSDELWTDPWCDRDVAEQQMAGVKADMASWLGGQPHAAFDPYCAVLFHTDDVHSVADWQAVVGELCRVSKRYVMLHRVQCHGADMMSRVKTKTAYGVEMKERSFDGAELIMSVETRFNMRHVFSTTWSKTRRSWQLSCLFEKVG